MYQTVYDIQDFYKTPRGEYVHDLLGRKIRSIWPDVSALQVAGLGYATPYLDMFVPEAKSVLAFMPAGLGVHHWPGQDSESRNRTALVEQTELPLETNSIDRLLIIHGIEFSEVLRSNLQELWRVLKSNGRLILVVPNRMGLWVGSDKTPFGQGVPYTAGQISYFLKDNFFVHEKTHHVLYLPPRGFKVMYKLSSAFETLGHYLAPAFAGIYVVEASKQVYAGISSASAVSRPMIRGRKWIMPKPARTPRVLETSSSSKNLHKLKTRPDQT